VEGLEGSGRGLIDVLSGYCPGGDEKTYKEPECSQSLNPHLNLGHRDYVTVYGLS